ncbi:MAG TPA: patatin-like phospholipase RssA [Burkholderiales bacterium]|nr:patatin-like phospholipase RssA [Burkholderiales bacterium]
MARRPKIGFALGAGSARGWAHIGVLRALQSEGVKPDLIAGCSVGALVGAAFAASRLDQLEAWALAFDWRSMLRMIDIRLRGGLIKGERVTDFFRQELVESEFSELAIPFAAVATDLHSGQEIWLREGRVSDAVRASIAVPGLFRAVLREGRYLIDGGVVNPVPVSLARAMGADIVIAVDVGSDIVGRHARRKREDSNTQTGRHRLLGKLFPRRDGAPAEGETGDPPSMLEALMGSIDVMQVRIARSRLAGEPPDVLLTPRLAHLGSLDYHRAAIAIAEGREAVARMLPAIRDAIPA